MELHKATYYPLRADYPQLPAQLVISARGKASQALKSALTGKVKRAKEYPRKVAEALARGKAVPVFKTMQCPQSKLSAIRYDQRSDTVRGDCISVATIQGRQVLALQLYPYAIRLLEQTIGYDSADLIYRKGKFWLHVVVTLPELEFVPNGEIVGVDFGVTRPAVASNNKFFSKRSWKATERRYFRLRRALQSQGSDRAKRHLKKLSHKVSRFRSNCDHGVSRQVVHSVTPGTLIVIENLREIRSTTKQNSKQQKRAMHQWSFNRLRDLLAYKAEAHGCRVVGINPRHTSQACSRCGCVHRSNRRAQSRFKCQHCGFELNADLNASLGIAEAGGLRSTSLSWRHKPQATT